MLTFPPDFPGDAIATVINAVKTKSFDKSQLAEALWNLIGYGLGKSVGGSPIANAMAMPEGIEIKETLTDEEVEDLFGKPRGMISQMIVGPAAMALARWALDKLAEYVLDNQGK